MKDIDYNNLRPTDWLPTSVKEMKARGWDYVDVVLFSGDAYVDHPSFGSAVIGRVLEAAVTELQSYLSPTGRMTCATSKNSVHRGYFSEFRRSHGLYGQPLHRSPQAPQR